MTWQKRYRHTRSGRWSTRLRELYRDCSEAERRLSPEFFERYREGRGTGSLTPLRGVRQGLGILDHARRFAERNGGEASLRDRLLQTLTNETTREIHVAVSGGIDAWLLAALLQAEGRRVRGWYLESGVEGYCERAQVARMASALHIECEFVRVSAGEFIESLPDFVTATETPIYNLHPVSKLLLARELARRGVQRIVTGDGADQVMRGDRECDLLPLTHACFRAAGVAMVAPFLRREVISLVDTPYSDKQPVRSLAARLGVPAVAKRPTLFPDIPMPASPRVKLPHRATHADACLAYTTGLLLRDLEEGLPCAASPE